MFLYHIVFLTFNAICFSMESSWMQAHPTPPCTSTNGQLTSKMALVLLHSTASVMQKVSYLLWALGQVGIANTVSHCIKRTFDKSDSDKEMQIIMSLEISRECHLTVHSSI